MDSSERVAICGRDINRYLNLLRTLIHESSWTQLEVQDQLGWGRSYISQLVTAAKTLRFDQVLNILNIIDVSPGEFYGRLYRPGGNAAVPLAGHQDIQALWAELDSVKAVVEALLGSLERKGVLDAADLATTEKARAEPLGKDSNSGSPGGGHQVRST